MKRDLICISKILKEILDAKKVNKEKPIELKLKGYSSKVVDFQLMLLKDAEFIKTAYNDAGRELPTRLTWKGFEYIDQTFFKAAGVIEDGIEIVTDSL